MAVEDIEKYRQQNGDDVLKVLIKPTKPFPKGAYFYCDASDEELVSQHSWRLYTQKQSYVVAAEKTYRQRTLRFHQEKAFNILSYYPNCINHINMVEFDNVNRNLDVVTSQQNQWCKPSKGYWFTGQSFYPYVAVNSRHIYDKCVRTEAEACQVAYQLELQYEDYRYEFLKDRRKDLELLDMERTGKISEEEAIYRHVFRHAVDDAWYLYRYNLFEYFRDNNLNVPAYAIDGEGYMTHSVTGQRLCPL